MHSLCFIRGFVCFAYVSVLLIPLRLPSPARTHAQVKYIRKNHGDYFGISVAGYPEGHPNRIKEVPGGVESLSEAEKGRCKVAKDADGKEVVTVCSGEGGGEGGNGLLAAGRKGTDAWRAGGSSCGWESERQRQRGQA